MKKFLKFFSTILGLLKKCGKLTSSSILYKYSSILGILLLKYMLSGDNTIFCNHFFNFGGAGPAITLPMLTNGFNHNFKLTWIQMIIDSIFLILVQFTLRMLQLDHPTLLLLDFQNTHGVPLFLDHPMNSLRCDWIFFLKWKIH